jgi:glutaredoxin
MAPAAARRRPEAAEDIAVYGRDWCPHSVRARDAASGLLGRPVAIQEAEPPGLRKPGHSTIPNVVVNGRPVGGADDLQALISSGALVGPKKNRPARKKSEPTAKGMDGQAGVVQHGGGSKKRKPSAYALFYKAFYKENKGKVPLNEMMSKAAAKWRAMKPDAGKKKSKK